MKALVIFFIIGILLFFLDGLRQVDTIVIDAAVRKNIAGLWETQMGRSPSTAELTALLDDWVHDEMFYREASRLGLGQHDVIVRRRLIQKLNFMLQGSADKTDDTEINEFYQAYLGKYSAPERFSFSHIYFSDLEDSLELKKQLKAGADWRTLGDVTLLPKKYYVKSQREITSELGSAFASWPNQLRQGQWVGPLESSFGYHLARLERRDPAAPRPLSEVRQKVIADLQQARQAASLAAYETELKRQYEVIYK